MTMHVDFKNLEKSVRVKMTINDEKFEMFFFFQVAVLQRCARCPYLGVWRRWNGGLADRRHGQTWHGGATPCSCPTPGDRE